MAKSMSTPWLETTLVDLIAADAAIDDMDDAVSIGSKGATNRKYHHVPKVVQVLSCNPTLRILEISDGQHTIHVFYPAKCGCVSVVEDVGASQLKHSMIKLKNYHVTTTVIAAGDREQDKVAGKISFPFAILCKDFQYIGGHDLEKLNNPTSVNSSTQVKSLIDKQAYRLIVKRLAFRQFNGRYLPQADGEEGAGDERFAEDGWTLTREHLFPVNEAVKSSGSPDSVTIISGAAITFLHSEISRAYARHINGPEAETEMSKALPPIPEYDGTQVATQVDTADDADSAPRFSAVAKVPVLSALEGTLMEEVDDEAEEPDLLNGQVIQLLDTQVPTQLVPQELLMTQVDSQAEGPMAGTQVPDDSQSTGDRTQETAATLAASPAAARGRSNGSQTPPAPASSYQEVASRLEQDLLVSSLRLEERLGVFSPATQVPVPIAPEDGAAKGSVDAPSKTASPAKKEATKTNPVVSTRAPSVDPTPAKAALPERDFVGQKIAKYVEGLEFREVRGIVRVHNPTNRTLVLEFETGELMSDVPVHLASYNFVMDDGDGASTAGSADWSKPFPPPLWPVRTAAAPQAATTGSSSGSGGTNVVAAVQAVSGATNTAAETVVVPFVLPKVGPVAGENSDDDDDDDDDDLIMTQPQTRFRGSQATDTPESAASSTVSRTNRRTRSSATADIDLEALQLKQQMDALLADYDNDRNAMALEAGIVSDAETSRDGRQTRSRSGLSRFFRRKETATRGAAKSMETIEEEQDDEDDVPSASTTAPLPRPGSLMAKFIARARGLKTSAPSSSHGKASVPQGPQQVEVSVEAPLPPLPPVESDSIGAMKHAPASLFGRLLRKKASSVASKASMQSSRAPAQQQVEAASTTEDEEDAAEAVQSPAPSSSSASTTAQPRAPASPSQESSSSVRSSGMKRQRQATLTELASFQTRPRGRTRSAATSGEVLSSFSGHEADTEAVDNTATRIKRRRVEEPPGLSQDSQTSTERITRSNARHPSAATQRSSSVLAAIMRRSNLLGKPPKRRNRL